MKNDNDNLIAALNDLVVINHDRTEGYTKAADEAKEHGDLAELFSTYAFRSKGYASAIATHVRSLGGEPKDGTKETGKLYRVWMDIKAALAKNDRKAVLKSCEFGEDVALDHYNKVLEDKEVDITAEIRSLLEEQRLEIQSAHDHVKEMRDATADIS